MRGTIPKPPNRSIKNHVSRRKIIILFALLSAPAVVVGAVFLLGGASSAMKLDCLAQPYFAQAEAGVPIAVQELSSIGGMVELRSRMVWDGLAGTELARSYLESSLVPVIQPCLDGVQVYGLELNSEAFSAGANQISINGAQGALYAVGGLAMESMFLRSTLATLAGITSGIGARLAAVGSSSVACAVLDGPLPLGDVVGAVATVGGVAWFGHDLWQLRSALPEGLSTVLHQGIQACREICRMEVGL